MKDITSHILYSPHQDQSRRKTVSNNFGEKKILFIGEVALAVADMIFFLPIVH